MSTRIVEHHIKYVETHGYDEPDRKKCFICNHIFDEYELRWASPFMETLCDACHTKHG